MRNRTQTVDMELELRFRNEVTKYISLMSKHLNGDTLFGSPIAIPTRNLSDIKTDYINKSIELMVENGIKRNRAKSISKYVFEKALEDTMTEVGM